jgi:hypothetical protein
MVHSVSARVLTPLSKGADSRVSASGGIFPRVPVSLQFPGLAMTLRRVDAFGMREKQFSTSTEQPLERCQRSGMKIPPLVRFAHESAPFDKGVNPAALCKSVKSLGQGGIPMAAQAQLPSLYNPENKIKGSTP